MRQIQAPNEALKTLQRKLNQILQAVYHPRRSVHGFCPDRSIVTNATDHVGREHVLNVDLQDFFPSIHFGRVWGMLKSPPYGLPHDVAAYIAQLCTHGGALPQGAPTSPTVSNMVCARMDAELGSLAKRWHCKYTRYADDITFSTDRKKFPNELAIKVDGGLFPSTVVGAGLTAIIEANGFQINSRKVRLQKQGERQAVTGLVVNQGLNVPREFVRQLRAMLHAWSKFGYVAASEEYFNKYRRKRQNPDLEDPTYKRVIEGKLLYLKMIRGRDNLLYFKLNRWFERLADGFDDPSPSVALASIRYPTDDITDALFVVSGNDFDSQGTGFLLENVGIVTCAHVVAPYGQILNKIEIWRSDNVASKYQARVIMCDHDVDLAVLTVDGLTGAVLRRGRGSPVRTFDEVTVAGFPNYGYGNKPCVNPGRVSSDRVPIKGINRFMITAAIFKGVSGGPVVNSAHQVIGVAVVGAANPAAVATAAEFGVIPIDALDRMVGKAIENLLRGLGFWTP